MIENPKIQAGGTDDPVIQKVAQAALAYVRAGDRVGLGSGRASNAFIEALGAKVQQGMRIAGVPTSENSARLAQKWGIPLIELGEDVELDLTVDGADEVTRDLDMVKGWGGALVRERIVAAASKRQIILVGEEKMVGGLGERGRIPVEFIPLAAGFVARRLKALGAIPVLRLAGAAPYVTDNGNHIYDCRVPVPLSGPAARDWERATLEIAGVVDTGLFLGTAERVILGLSDGNIEIRTRL